MSDLSNLSSDVLFDSRSDLPSDLPSDSSNPASPASSLRVSSDQPILASSSETGSTIAGSTIAGSTIAKFDSYRTVEATYASLAQLAADNPALATWVDIGDSYNKVSNNEAPGYDIFALQLGQPAADQPKPVFLLQAAIHGQDYVTTELATRFAEFLVASYGVALEATWLLDYFDIRIVPIVNPDGRKLAEAGNPWQKNANPTVPDGQSPAPFPNYGVNLDRNFNLQWGKVANGASLDPASPVYQGSAAFSEPESLALRNYLFKSFGGDESDDQPGVFINLQGSGNQILYPYNWKSAPAADQEELRNLGLKLSSFTAGSNSNGTGTNPTPSAYEVRQGSSQGVASGTAIDWVYQILGAASYTISAGTKAFEPSAVFESEIVPKLLPALAYAVKAAASPYELPLGPDVRSLSLASGQAIVGITNSVNLSATIDSSRSADLPLPIVAGARYSIDAPSWVPEALLFDMLPKSGDLDSPVETLEAAVNTSNLAPGRHTIFVEGLDEDGNYGVPAAIFLDVLLPPENANVLRGTEANDVLTPTALFNFVALGQGSDDRIQTLAGTDLILAGPGNDTVSAGEGDDRVYGGVGNDQLTGGGANDQLYGEAGADRVFGGEGDDLLWGGAGGDQLTGGAGQDTFALVYNEGSDKILDFAVGVDKLGLVGTLKFNQLSIRQAGEVTQIQYGRVTLAELTGVTADALTAADFVSI
ncbi:MAG: M14 family zinc carboxypeptidase [Leptolyngbya sp. IPPAS B-1204]|nr:MAG: hypothetical protein EDM05_03510 [Leptolyngbya sp. IPPAS B-1204]